MTRPNDGPVEYIARVYGTEIGLTVESDQELSDEFLEQLPQLRERVFEGFDNLTNALHRRSRKRVRKWTYADFAIMVFTLTGPVTVKINVRTHRKLTQYKFNRLVRNHVGMVVGQQLDLMLEREQSALVAAEMFAELHPELPAPLLLDVNRLAAGQISEFLDEDPAFVTYDDVAELVATG